MAATILSLCHWSLCSKVRLITKDILLPFWIPNQRYLILLIFFRNPIKDQRPPPCPQMPTVKMQNPPCPFHTFNPLCGDVEPFRLSPLLKKTLQHMLKRYIVRQLCRYFLHIANFLFFARKMPTIRNIWFCHHVDCLVLLLRSFFFFKKTESACFS